MLPALCDRGEPPGAGADHARRTPAFQLAKYLAVICGMLRERAAAVTRPKPPGSLPARAHAGIAALARQILLRKTEVPERVPANDRGRADRLRSRRLFPAAFLASAQDRRGDIPDRLRSDPR
jgi:hypothetical protein